MAGSMTLAELILKLKVDDKEAAAVMSRIKSDAKETGKQAEASFSSLASGVKVGALAAAAAVGVVVGVLKKCVDEAAQAEAAVTKLNVVLKATGADAWTSSQELQNMAKQYQRTTVFSDEMVMSGQAVLLRFREIGEKTLPQATEAMLNMATVMDKDVAGAALVLGKALQAPEKASGILFRAGVVLSDQQEKQIKTWVALGQVGKAQKLILEEIAKASTGAAAEMGKTYEGRLMQMKNAMSEVQEAIGNIFLPSLKLWMQGMASFLFDVADAIQKVQIKYLQFDAWWNKVQAATAITQQERMTAMRRATDDYLRIQELIQGKKEGGAGGGKKPPGGGGLEKITAGTRIGASDITAPGNKEIMEGVISFTNDVANTASGIMSGLDNVMGMYYSNQAARIDNDLTKKLDAIQTVYNAERQAIENSTMNQKQKVKALEALDEKRARDEKKAIEKADKAKRKYAHDAAKIQRAIDIGQAISNTALGITSILAHEGWNPILVAALSALVASIGAAQVALISKQPLPPLASGGLFTGPALIAEKGREVALPLEGDEGRAAMREMAGAMLDMISTRLDTGATVGPGGASGGGNSGIYLDGRLVGEWITGASNNGQIQISNRSVV